jgi:hypothetical protein
MLRLPKNLLFPTLVHLNEVNFKKLSSKGKIGVYRLDWAKINEIKHERWKEQFPPSSVSFIGSLPEDLRHWVDRMQFALSEDYLQEIRYCSIKAAEEWDRKRPITHGMDPAIGPTLSFVSTAFHLLSDCLFDPDTEYYSRSGTKAIAPFILSYNFWAYQTEYWQVKQWANLPDFLKFLEQLKEKDQTTYLFGMKIYENLQSHFQRLEKNHYYKRTPERIHLAENMDLDDFLMNKVADVTLDDQFFKIPDIGEINLIKPVRLRKTRGKITLNAEFQCQNMQKALMEIPNYKKSFSFFIINEKHLINAHGAVIKNISSNPPPQLTIEILNLEIKNEPPIKPDDFLECRKIDRKKIEEAMHIKKYQVE